MGLKQLSIFLENSPGRLFEVTEAFGKAGVNLKALTLAESSGFGVLRLLVSDLGIARKIAMEKNWPARVDDVVAVKIPDVPGSLAELLKPLKENKVNVEYMYAFTGLSSDFAVMIFKFKKQEEAKSILEQSGASLLSASEFGGLMADER